MKHNKSTRVELKVKTNSIIMRIKSEKLSTRELEVLHFIASGYTVKEIAQLLFISETTVKSHTKNARAKLQTKNICHTVARAIQYKLLGSNY